MDTAVGPYTITDLLRMRQETKERLEMIGGEVFVVPTSSVLHQGVLIRFIHALFVRVDLAGAGNILCAPIDVRLSDVDVVQPDLVVVLANGDATLAREAIVGPPALVVEIVSPTSRVQDLHLKRRYYAEAGIPEYWIVDLGPRSVLVLSDPAGGSYRTETTFAEGGTLRSAIIREFAVPVADLFPPTTEGEA